MNLQEECQYLIETTNKYNLSSKAKHLKEIVFEATKVFPKKITLSQRIRAIATNNECKCQSCGKIHGKPDDFYCNLKCYFEFKSRNKFTEEEHQQRLFDSRVELANKKFKNGIEGYDYIVCKICGYKCGEISHSHLLQHGYTTEQYRLEFNLKTLKAQAIIDNGVGDNNPSYVHGGNKSKTNPLCLEYWVEYTNNDKTLAKELYNEKLKSVSLEKYILKHGIEKGTISWNIRYNSDNNTNSKGLSHINNRTLWKNTFNDLGLLYVLDIGNDKIKIGITSNTLQTRYVSLKYSEIKTYTSNISQCFQIEQLLKKKLKDYKITKSEEVYGFGWTETFNNKSKETILEFCDYYFNSPTETTKLFKESFNLKYHDNF